MLLAVAIDVLGSDGFVVWLSKWVINPPTIYLCVTPEKYSVRENNFRAPKKLIDSPKTLLECRDAVIMKLDSSRNCSRSLKYIARLAWLALTRAPVSGRAQPLIRRQNDGWEALGIYRAPMHLVKQQNIVYHLVYKEFMKFILLKV
ncbi:hypothetical protein BDZ97DRAFT_2063051 [Flammula alnicola]|nr:hypothetical protein BDZ97DRAFT_2063051 [Flammula alnicola]